MLGRQKVVRETTYTDKPVDASQPVVDGPAVQQTLVTPGGDYVQAPVDGVPITTPSGDVVYLTRSDEVRLAVSRRIQDILGFIFSIAAILIVLRFVLLAAGANSASGFVQYVMAWSQPLVAPFQNLFANPVLRGAGVFEIGDIIAIAIYGLVTALLCKLVSLLISPTLRRRVYIRQ